ncbi:MAG: hypothetical protein ACPL7K_08590, partial [Armatimonadota bacterium]
LDGGVLKTSSVWLSCGGSDPPTDRFLKIAQVIRQVDENTFEQSMYWDTGAGLTQIGASVTIPASQVNAFGQYDTDCLVDPSGGKRYDGFGIMDVAMSVPQRAGQIVFDELRLYAGAMTPDEIAQVRPVHAPLGDMVGHWTFDNYLGTSPLDSKVPGITWDPLVLTPGSGARIEDGKLVLPRYVSGSTYKQSNAYTRLKTDLGIGGYFRQMTLVAWMKWPGFDTASVWSRVMAMVKSATAYNPNNQATIRGAQSIVMKATDNWNWGAHRAYEKSDNTVTVHWAKNGGSDPPSDRYIKIAQVVRVYDATKYAQAMYWDIGNGLEMIGTENTGLWNAWVMPFGQYGTECIPFPGNGLRYDAFAFMDFSWAPIVQSAGEILFEEARIYAGAMTADEIAGLSPAPFVPVPEPSAVVALACGVIGLVGIA